MGPAALPVARRSRLLFRVLVVREGTQALAFGRGAPGDDLLGLVIVIVIIFAANAGVVLVLVFDEPDGIGIRAAHTSRSADPPH